MFLFVYYHDDFGHRVNTRDARGNETREVYNSRGQLESSTDAEDATTRYFYDVNTGNMTAGQDALGNFTRY